MRAAILLIMLAFPGALHAAAAQQDRCYEWSDAAPIVRRENLFSAKDLHEQARRKIEGDLIRITLCEHNGDYVYRLVVQHPGGRVRHMMVDARAPF
jgi:uncharacterized membrane protein YkoI